MKTLRSPDDICLLCQTNKSDKKGSHYTPAGIMKREVGKRDYEELYSINSFQASTSVFLGRSNLKNTDITIQQGGQVEDYIFCKTCEKQLAIIESECNEKLIQLTDALLKGNLPIDKTNNDNKYISLKHPNRNVLILYFYSIIWRQWLQQKILFQTNFVTNEFEEILRQIIHREISEPLKNIEQSKEFEKYPSLIILTTYHRGDRTKNFINPNPIRSNPELSFIGAFNSLIFISQNVSLGFEIKTGLPKAIVDNNLIINNSDESIIGVINEASWGKATKHLVQHEVDRYLHTMTTNLSRATGIPYHHAQRQLHLTAQKFKAEFPDNYAKCLELAFERLTK